MRAGGRHDVRPLTAAPMALAAATAALVFLASLSLFAAVETGGEGGDPFDRDADALVLDLVDAADRDELALALEDAGRNWPELAGALEALGGEEREACLTLVTGMPHLDRLEMTAGTLTEHVSLAFRAKEQMPYDVPDDMFEPYILTYRIEEEPVQPWRAELYERFAPLALREGNVVSTARAINAELAQALAEREWEFFGPRQSPVLTLRSGSGTEADIAVLACAALKAVGIPSRQASVAALGGEDGGAHWIEIFDGAEWLPMFPLDPDAFGDFGYPERDHPDNVTVVSSTSAFEQVLVTERYSETGTIEFEFVEDGGPAAGFESFSLSVPNDGSLAPLDALEAVAGDDGVFRATVGEGRYVALAGVRDASGNPLVMMRDVLVTPGATVALGFDVTPRAEAEGLDRAALLDMGQVITVVAMLEPGHEPSMRMLPLISGAVARRSGSVRLVCAFRGAGGAGYDELRRLAGPSADIMVLDGHDDRYEDVHGVVTGIPDGGDEFPLVRAYLNGSGETLIESHGYDLNIARRLEAGIDSGLAGLLTERGRQKQ